MKVPELIVNGNINEVLISDYGAGNAKDTALSFADKESKQKLNSNQLRKYYTSFERIYNSNLKRNEKRVKLLMLKANIEYSAKRLKIQKFADYIKEYIDKILKADDQLFDIYMEAFKLHFESLVAYFPKK